MLNNLTYITIFGLIWGSMILFSYRTGYKDGREIFEPPELKGTVAKAKDIKPKTSSVQQKERERFSRLLENIDNYDGTGAGQKEV